MLNTAAMAHFAIETRTQDIPADVLEGARNALIDTFGAGLAGSREPVGALAMRWVDELGGRGKATLWATGTRTSVPEAAFANGIFAHALDFDDSLPTLRGHPSAPVVASALAVGESVGARGADVLAAYAIALEIAGKLGRVLGNEHYLQGWHNTSTIGTFTSTAVAARLWGLTVAELQVAWGLAASQLSGLVRNFGTMTKPFHVGRAARCGVMSAWFAKHGFTADGEIFDHAKNVFQTYGAKDAAALGALLDSLGNPWEIREPGNWVKRWPCCYCSHRAIGGLFELMQRHDIRAGDIQEIAVGFLPGTDEPLISTNPQTGLEGKFSVEYALAAAALDGALTLDTFTDAMVQRSPARALIAKVRRYRIEDRKVYGLDAYTDIAVTTSKGRYEMRVERTPGSPAWPLTLADRRAKFLDCAGIVLGKTRAERVLQLAQQCTELPDIGQLVAATVPGERDDQPARTA